MEVFIPWLNENLWLLTFDLTIASLQAYGFDLHVLKLIHSYLTGRKKRFPVNTCFNERASIALTGVKYSDMGYTITILLIISLQKLINAIHNPSENWYLYSITNKANDNFLFTVAPTTRQVTTNIEADAENVVLSTISSKLNFTYS